MNFTALRLKQAAYKAKIFTIRKAMLEVAEERKRQRGYRWRVFLTSVRREQQRRLEKVCPDCDYEIVEKTYQEKNDRGHRHNKTVLECCCNVVPSLRTLRRMLRRLAGVNSGLRAGQMRNTREPEHVGKQGRYGFSVEAWENLVGCMEDDE